MIQNIGIGLFLSHFLPETKCIEQKMQRVTLVEKKTAAVIFADSAVCSGNPQNPNMIMVIPTGNDLHEGRSENKENNMK